MGSLSSPPPGSSTVDVDSTSPFVCNRDISLALAAVPSMTDEDAGTSILPARSEATIRVLGGTVLTAVASDSWDRGLRIRVLDSDGGAEASTSLGAIGGRIERSWFWASGDPAGYVSPSGCFDASTSTLMDTSSPVSPMAGSVYGCSSISARNDDVKDTYFWAIGHLM